MGNDQQCTFVLACALVYQVLDLAGMDGGPEFKKYDDTYPDYVDTWAGLMEYCQQL